MCTELALILSPRLLLSKEFQAYSITVRESKRSETDRAELKTAEWDWVSAGERTHDGQREFQANRQLFIRHWSVEREKARDTLEKTECWGCGGLMKDRRRGEERDRSCAVTDSYTHVGWTRMREKRAVKRLNSDPIQNLSPSQYEIMFSIKLNSGRPPLQQPCFSPSFSPQGIQRLKASQIWDESPYFSC